MTFDAKSLRSCSTVALVATVIILVLLAVPGVQAQEPVLDIVVGDTTALPGEQNSVISVYLSHFFPDTIAAFNLWLFLDYHDIMEFQTSSGISIDTTYYDCVEWSGEVCVDTALSEWFWECIEWDGDSCIDSIAIPGEQGVDYDFRIIDTTDIYIGNFDTTGTLISGWDWVQSRSLGGIGQDINIAAMAQKDGTGPDMFIPPQQGGVLIKLLADVFNIEDTIEDRTTNILIQHEFIDHFSFSRPNGTSMGIAYRQILDTNMWVCLQWIEETCVAWERTSTPPYDSIEIVPDSVAYIDTTIVLLTDGSLRVLDPPPWICGDINGDTNGPNIQDLTFFVAYLFGGGAPPPVMEAADVNCSSGNPNIQDLTFFVAYLFSGGGAPCDDVGSCPPL